MDEIKQELRKINDILEKMQFGEQFPTQKVINVVEHTLKQKKEEKSNVYKFYNSLLKVLVVIGVLFICGTLFEVGYYYHQKITHMYDTNAPIEQSALDQSPEIPDIPNPPAKDNPDAPN